MHIVRGIVVHFDERPPDPDDPAALLAFVDRAILSNARRRSDLEHTIDVTVLALGLWTGDTSLQIGDDWHIEEKGVGRLWKGMSAGDFAAKLKGYLVFKIRRAPSVR